MIFKQTPKEWEGQPDEELGKNRLGTGEKPQGPVTVKDFGFLGPDRGHCARSMRERSTASDGTAGVGRDHCFGATDSGCCDVPHRFLFRKKLFFSKLMVLPADYPQLAVLLGIALLPTQPPACQRLLEERKPQCHNNCMRFYSKLNERLSKTLIKTGRSF